MSSERERRYLAHIAESVELIADYVRDGRAAFFEQRQVQDAVLRRLEILADATVQLSPELKESSPRYPVARGLRVPEHRSARLPRH